MSLRWERFAGNTGLSRSSSAVRRPARPARSRRGRLCELGCHSDLGRRRQYLRCVARRLLAGLGTTATTAVTRWRSVIERVRKGVSEQVLHASFDAVVQDGLVVSGSCQAALMRTDSPLTGRQLHAGISAKDAAYRGVPMAETSGTGLNGGARAAIPASTYSGSHASDGGSKPRPAQRAPAPRRGTRAGRHQGRPRRAPPAGAAGGSPPGGGLPGLSFPRGVASHGPVPRQPQAAQNR